MSELRQAGIAQLVERQLPKMLGAVLRLHDKPFTCCFLVGRLC